jgi:ferredoxin
MLDSGLDAGLELPFTCRGGICGACVGRVVEGEVDMSDVRLMCDIYDARIYINS